MKREPNVSVWGVNYCLTLGREVAVDKNNAEDIKLTDLISIDMLREFNDAFAKAFNVTSTIVEPDGTYIIEPVNLSKVCTLIRKTKKGMEGCLKSEALLAKKAREIKEPVIVPCLNIGFADSFAPIFIKDKHVATWLVGQFCTLDVDRERIESFGKEIGADVEEMLKGLNEMARRKVEEFEKGINLLWVFSKGLSRIAYTSYELKGEVGIRKMIEEEFRHSQGKMSAMLSSIPDHMSMMDKDLNILWANEIAKKIFGDDIIGKKCYEIYHKRKEPCVPSPCLTLKAFKDGKIHEHDTEVIDKDGNKIYFHCTANTALRNKEGEPEAVIEISRNVTERVKSEEEKEKHLKELEVFYKAAVDREERILKLKEEVQQLKERLGEK